MTTPVKLTTIGIGLVTLAALGTGLTTAYFTRATVTADAEPVAMAAPAPLARGGITNATASRPAPTLASRPVYRPVATPAVPVASVPADCATGGDRAWRIAKPGVIGGLIGAGVGAAGSAIADGGKAAGKGALIGGLAGAALGGGYGAYRTKQECGTIFGDTDAPRAVSTPETTAGRSVGSVERADLPEAAFQATSSPDRITIFRAH